MTGAAAVDHDTPVPTGGLAETLLGFLAYLRESVVRKLDGLDDEQLRWSPVASGTSLLGLVRHLATVEEYWVSRVAGVDFTPSDSSVVVDRGCSPAAADTAAAASEAYQAAAERTDALLQGPDLSRPLPRGRQGHTVGWVLVHLLEETARHAGHADIIREQIDGSAGR